MSEKRVDYYSASQLIRGQTERIDDLDAAINAVPVSLDGGAASDEIAFVLTAVLESAGVASDTMRVLYAVAEDALLDLATHDQDIADALKAFEAEVLDA